ncbi:MAG TPA: carbonic anhydrase [Thermoanaerobaculia bacterium]
MRIAVRVASLLTFVLLVACASVPPPPADPGAREWKLLEDGNAAFRTGTITFTGLRGRRETQAPPVTVLACSDSRVPPELVFHQTLGRLFVVRTAGNVADAFGIASIEYAIEKGYTKLLVILAHEKCGAVEEAIKADPQCPIEATPSLDALVKKILESFTPPCCTLQQPNCWVDRTRGNALYAVSDLKKRSTVIRDAIDVRRLPVVVAYFDLDGNVTVWQRIH